MTKIYVMMVALAIGGMNSVPAAEAKREVASTSCKQKAERAAMAAFRREAKAEGKKPTLRVTRSDLISSLETDPPVDTFEITVDSNLPGWKVYQVSVRAMNSRCVIGSILETDSE